MAEFFAEANTTPAQLRTQPLAGRVQLSDEIYDRAPPRYIAGPMRKLVASGAQRIAQVIASSL
jgi:hypothetical protein